MTSTNTYLAVFTGGPQSPRMAQWNALGDAEKQARQKDGIAAWQAWMKKHEAAVVGPGGPLGKTKRVSPKGIEDASNPMSAFVIVRADSPEAAAKLFEGHPHFTIFPGDGVDVMPVLPVPGG